MDSPGKQLGGGGGRHSHPVGDLKGEVTVSAFLKTPSTGTPPSNTSPGSTSGSSFEPHLSTALHKIVMKPGLMPTSDLELAMVTGVAVLEKL